MIERRLEEEIPRSAGEITFQLKHSSEDSGRPHATIGAPNATAFVVAQRRNGIAGFLQAAGQDRGIFESLTRALAEIRGHWVRCIAEQCHSLMAPAFQGRSIIIVRPDNDALVGSFDQLGNRFVPWIKSFK